MSKLLRLFLMLFLVFPPQTVHAWSEGGHHLIAAIAFSLLTDQEQDELLAVLKQHPRFAEDFVPPDKLANDEERTRWIVGRAGYWPDVARKQPKYHRATWHYELGPTIVLGSPDGIAVPYNAFDERAVTSKFSSRKPCISASALRNLRHSCDSLSDRIKQASTISGCRNVGSLQPV